jgi:hypothetical protein
MPSNRDEHDRDTPPVDLGDLARRSEREPEGEPSSGLRPRTSLSLVPWLMITLDRLSELPIEPNAAFLVSLVDGQCSVELIADIAGMPRDEVAGIFERLAQLGAVELRDPG